jgi:uncharacterized metal-binding protein
MKKIIRITESDLVKFVKRVINEQSDMRNLSLIYDCLGISAVGLQSESVMMIFSDGHPNDVSCDYIQSEK